MVRNEEKYLQALEFRKRGFTYSEISKICGVSKATVSNWLSNQSFSKDITKLNTARAAKENKKRISLLNKAKKAERAKTYSQVIKSAETEFKHYKANPVFIAGLMIYFTNGDVSESPQIRLTTKNPIAHRIFITFAIEYLGVEKKHIKFWLLLSGQSKLELAMRSWSKAIGISFARFGRTQYVNPNATSLHKGTGNTIIGNTVLKRKLIRWIELSTKELQT